ncbi:serine/threonine protein kinase [Streptomyces triticagri]|uniref:Serine/threonine protein kinase n=1 Tax=Streptomyces triticagri TaxID=2293568 RepID=A0A372M1I5_9ACTN|nr:serine/threonine protein kinase [Streptomyces triticagri]RFU84147.1 serine/threonine protein kinase [Streptomyces triticagri]
MHTIIVELPEVPGAADAPPGRPRQLRLRPGESADFGRGGEGSSVRLRLSDPGVSRIAGQITAAEDYWRLSNYSSSSTYAVENMEGAGEYIKVAPGRLGAPVPFEFSRVLLPSRGGEATFKVYAPEHAYLDGDRMSRLSGEPTQTPFALDRTSKYFLVLLALCEPRLRNSSSGAVPGVVDVLERLRPLASCRDLKRSAVNRHIEYLVMEKLRLGDGNATSNKRAELVSFALRFDLVREEHLPLLPPRDGRGSV